VRRDEADQGTIQGIPRFLPLPAELRLKKMKDAKGVHEKFPTRGEQGIYSAHQGTQIPSFGRKQGISGQIPETSRRRGKAEAND
jgi:hypothetical protein